MRALGLDRAGNLDLQIRVLADTRAGQIALQAGAVVVILSEFVWGSVQRGQGSPVTVVPRSVGVGGQMADPAAGIATAADLKGRRLAVSSSPVDKSYVILTAYYAKATGGRLAEDAEARFGAPPLIHELFTGGKADAALNLWTWNARATEAGRTELIGIGAMLAELGVPAPPPLLGWAFFEATAEAKGPALAAFLDASFDTKAALLAGDAIWDDLKPVMRTGDDAALFARLRDAYRAGIVAGYDPEDTEAAEQSFAVLAEFGGPEVVGPATALAPGTFWPGYRR
jgi:NitT/TauT family transport system substrate-binding protein